MSLRWLQVIHLFDSSVTYTLLYQLLLELIIDPGANVQLPKGCLCGVCIHCLTLLLASPLSYSFQDHYFVHVHLYTSQNSCGTSIHPASAVGPGSRVVSKETMAAVIMHLALLQRLRITVNSQFPDLWQYNFENFYLSECDRLPVLKYSPTKGAKCSLKFKGQRDGSAVTIAYCFCRRPGLNSHHP